MNAIPDWKLERYRLKELPESEARAISDALTNDAVLRARLEALDADDARTLAAHPPARVAARIELTARERVATRNRWWVPALSFAAVAVLTVAVLALRPSDEDVLRPKGDVALRLFRLEEGAETPERLADGAQVKQFDLVQVAFTLDGASNVVVVSVDGGGGATLHWPLTLDGDTQAPPGFKALPRAFELDDAPGFERFFLVASNSPLSPKDILDAARRAARSGQLEVPHEAVVRSLVLDKSAAKGAP